MKGKFLVVLFGLLFCLCVLSTLAKGEEQKPQLILMDEFVVKPSRIAEFEAASRETLAEWSKHKYPYSFKGYFTEDMRFIFITPLKNFADIDNYYTVFEELEKKMGTKKKKALWKRESAALNYIKSRIFYYLPELSYSPENPRLKPEEESFAVWSFYYIIPGMEDEFEAVSKEWVNLHREKNWGNGYKCYSGDFGTEIPVYLVIWKTKSEADALINLEKSIDVFGEEGKRLEEKGATLLRGFTMKRGWFRPDLSYIPKEKK
jgi:hypothetical protein